MSAQDFALVVGINSYPGLSDLNGPENDAAAFCEWLQSPTGGNIPAANCICITSSKFLEKLPNRKFPSVTKAAPIAASVHDEIDVWQDNANKLVEDGESSRLGRRLYFYYAGHGFAPRPDQTGLLMANATRDRIYHVLGNYLADWFYRAGYFDEVLLFMDCCREIYPIPALNMPYPDRVNQARMTKVKQFYAFGAQWSRASREHEMETGKTHGVFTKALLAGLKGAAAKPDGTITAASLSDYLINDMKSFLRPNELSDPRVVKEPEVTLKPYFDKWVLVKAAKVPAPPDTYPVSVSAPAGSPLEITEYVDGVRQVVIATDSAPSLWKVNLRRGMYRVEIPGSDKKQIIEVTGVGGTVDVTL